MPSKSLKVPIQLGTTQNTYCNYISYIHLKRSLFNYWAVIHNFYATNNCDYGHSAFSPHIIMGHFTYFWNYSFQYTFVFFWMQRSPLSIILMIDESSYEWMGWIWRKRPFVCMIYMQPISISPGNFDNSASCSHSINNSI